MSKVLKISYDDSPVEIFVVGVDPDALGIVYDSTEAHLELELHGVGEEGSVVVHGAAGMRWIDPDPLNGMPFAKTGQNLLTVDLTKIREQGLRFFEVGEGGAITGITNLAQALRQDAAPPDPPPVRRAKKRIVERIRKHVARRKQRR